MISSQKIDEWIREIEERPSSALIIVRYIANRLSDLTARNEELLAENIQLRTGKKIEEYETRIANLEYQLEMLKRQLGGDLSALSVATPAVETVSLLIFNAQGEVLRVELDPDGLASRKPVAHLAEVLSTTAGPEPVTRVLTPHLLVTGSHEELLFLFDSGRIETVPCTKLPVSTGDQPLQWKLAYLAEPRGAEELVAIVPIGRMSLADSIVQSSRRGFVKRMMRTAFEGHVSKFFVGTGVKLQADRTCGLTLCAKDDRFVMSSREGSAIALETGRMSYAIDESIRLSTTDHINACFALGSKKSLAFVTQTGKVIHREASWLEPAASGKSRGQAVFSEERRKSGVRLVGAAAVDEGDWCATLDSAGALAVHAISDVLGAGAIPVVDGEILAFAAFQGKS